MSDVFQERENRFEKEFAHDEDLRFRAVARRNKAMALWIADLKGLGPAESDKYAADFVAGHIGLGDAEVAAALKADLKRANVDLSEHRLMKRMEEEMAEAIASVKAGR